MGMATFMLAVSGTALVCYFLMTRAQNRPAQRRGAAGDSSGSSNGYDSRGEGSSIFSWFGGDSSSSLADTSSGSGDSCGGDGGGGGGGD
jgi:hypothetical protein